MVKKTTWWTEQSTRQLSDNSKLRLVGECDDVHIARSSTHKNVRRRRRGGLQCSSMSLSSSVPAWFPVSRHNLLQTAGLRSCSAIGSRTDPVLALRARKVQCSDSSCPSACPCIVFAVHYLPVNQKVNWKLIRKFSIRGDYAETSNHLHQSWLVLIGNVQINFGVIWLLDNRKCRKTEKLTPIISSVHVDY